MLHRCIITELQKSKSQGGLIIFLKDRSGSKCPLYWRSKKLERKIKSTIAAENLALNEGAVHSIYLAHILRELIDDKSKNKNLYS